MAHYTTMDGIGGITGALSKRKTQGVEKMMITRVKSVKDPLTGEVVGQGPQEMYTQYRRDYDEHPMTPAEQVQRVKWREACKTAAEIIKDKSHPLFMELYHRWREYNATSKTAMQFPNFVRHILSQAS